MRKSTTGASSSADRGRRPSDFNSLLITSFRACFQMRTLPPNRYAARHSKSWRRRASEYETTTESCAAHIWRQTWQRKNPATWQRKQAGIDHKEIQKVRKHEPRKAYCARTITILLVETRAVQSRARAHDAAPRLQGTTQQQHNRQVHVRRPRCSSVHVRRRRMWYIYKKSIGGW